MPTQVVASTDGPQLTVDAILRSPTIIPRLIPDITGQRFIADQLLRKAESNWVYEFFESTPLFAVNTPAVVGEGGEIPLTPVQVGNLTITRSVKRALGLNVSREMRQRNQIDLLNQSITQLSNSMVQVWDNAFITTLLAAPILTQASAFSWTLSTAVQRTDIAKAVQQIVDQKLGYTPDTIVINTTTATNLLGSQSTQIWAPWAGNVADQSPAVTGRLPIKLFGLDVWVSYSMPSTQAVVLERERVGFIGDEWPLETTPWYALNPQGGPNQSWRSDTSRSSSVGIDQPKSACLLTGV